MVRVFATQASSPGTHVKVKCGHGEIWEWGDPWMVMARQASLSSKGASGSVSDLVSENRVGNDVGKHTVLSSGLHMH